MAYHDLRQHVRPMGCQLRHWILTSFFEDFRGKIFLKDAVDMIGGDPGEPIAMGASATCAGVEAQYRDGADVRLRLSLVTIDAIAIAGCNAEFYGMIATRFKREASFGQQTLEVLSSHCKLSYAESAIVTDFWTSRTYMFRAAGLPV